MARVRQRAEWRAAGRDEMKCREALTRLANELLDCDQRRPRSAADGGSRLAMLCSRFRDDIIGVLGEAHRTEFLAKMDLRQPIQEPYRCALDVAFVLTRTAPGIKYYRDLDARMAWIKYNLDC